MPNLPPPTPARLGQPGLYILPAAEGFVAPVVAGGQLPVRLHFALADDTEFHLPISSIALGRLYSALKGLFDPPDAIPGRPVRVHEFTEMPTFDWDKEGQRVNADFLHQDGSTTGLEMSAAKLKDLLREIAEALERRPPQ